MVPEQAVLLLADLDGAAAELGNQDLVAGLDAERNALALDRAVSALAGRRVEIRNRCGRDPPLLCRAHDGERQRMLARPLDGGVSQVLFVCNDAACVASKRIEGLRDWLAGEVTHHCD